MCSFWKGSGQWSMADPGLFKAGEMQEVRPGGKAGQYGGVQRTFRWESWRPGLWEEGTDKSWEVLGRALGLKESRGSEGRAHPNGPTEPGHSGSF